MPIIWYKEKRTKEERKIIYQQLRALGIPPDWTRRVRDWSDNHIEQFIRAWQVLNNEKDF